jgi:hypothetical protein
MTFLEKMKIVCDTFDEVHGECPESNYEGKSLYEFVRRHYNFKHGIPEPVEDLLFLSVKPQGDWVSDGWDGDGVDSIDRTDQCR